MSINKESYFLKKNRCLFQSLLQFCEQRNNVEYVDDLTIHRLIAICYKTITIIYNTGIVMYNNLIWLVLTHIQSTATGSTYVWQGSTMARHLC